MLTVAFVLAILYTAAYAILFQKLPLPLRAWLSRRYVLLDIFLSMTVLTVLSFTLTGVLAGAMVALFVSVYLWWYKRFKAEDDIQELARHKASHPPILVWLCAKIYNLFRA